MIKEKAIQRKCIKEHVHRSSHISLFALGSKELHLEHAKKEKATQRKCIREHVHHSSHTSLFTLGSKELHIEHVKTEKASLLKNIIYSIFYILTMFYFRKHVFWKLVMFWLVQ